MFEALLKDVVESTDGGVSSLVMDLDGIALDSYSKPGATFDIKTIGVELSVVLAENDEAGNVPSPVVHGAGKDPVFVGRVRKDLSHPRGLNLWVVADNVRKGAALNAVQILEALEARGARGAAPS